MDQQVNRPSTTNKIIAALAYISIIFLPVVFPLIVWIVGSANAFVKKHARRAFWSQLLPALAILVFLVILGLIGAAGGRLSFTSSLDSVFSSMGWLALTFAALAGLIALVCFIYNVAMAVKIFVD